MNVIARWLAEGDLTSDGRANEVANVILNNPIKFGQFLDCFDSDDPVVRGHAADAAEKIAREKPEVFLPYMHIFFRIALEDPVGLVKQHLAMLFGHMALFSELVDPSLVALSELLDSPHIFTKNWAMTSLCIIAKLHPQYQPRVMGEIAQIEKSSKKIGSRQSRKSSSDLD